MEPTPLKKRDTSQSAGSGQSALERENFEFDSPDRLRTIIDAMPVQAWCALPDGSTEFQNRAWLDYAGLASEGTRCCEWSDAVHSDDLDGFLSKWMEIQASKMPGEVEARLRRFDGQYRWFLIRIVPVRDEQGNVVKWYGTNADIDDLKRAEALLSGEKQVLELIAKGNRRPPLLDTVCQLIEENDHLREDFRDLFDEAPIPYVHEGLDSRFIRANRAAMKLLGIDPGEVTGTFGKSFVADTPENLRRLHEAFASVGRGNATGGVVLELHRKDNGNSFWVQWWSRPARNGRFTRTVLVDITDQVLLEQTKAALEFSLESGQVGDWDLDLTNDTSRRSLRHDQCFGYNEPIPEAEWGFEVFIQHVHPEDRAHVQSSFRKAVEGLLDWGAEFRVLWADGSVHWLDARGRIYRTMEGKATRMLGIVMDITDRRKVEEIVRVSEQWARGQVEALKRTLDALAMEADPDRLLGHILRTITEQFGAHSSSVWRRDEAKEMIGFEYAFEDGIVVTKFDSRFDGMDLWLPMEDFWPWPEVFRTGKPSLIEDIRDVPPFALRNRLLPLGIITVLLIPMSIVGQLEGAIGLRFTSKRGFRPEEMELAQALANQAMLAMRLAHLYGQSRESAVIAERNRMARDIHDTLAQGFTGVIVQLEAAADARSGGMNRESEEHCGRAADLARESLREARRSVRALRPQILEENDLCEALETMFKKLTAGTGLEATLRRHGESVPLPPGWDEGLLRIAQESLANTLRHAHSTHFSADLFYCGDEIRLQLHDNGKGFDASAQHAGFGLLGIRERVTQIGGSLTIKSTEVDGTTIFVRAPLV